MGAKKFLNIFKASGGTRVKEVPAPSREKQEVDQLQKKIEKMLQNEETAKKAAQIIKELSNGPRTKTSK